MGKRSEKLSKHGENNNKKFERIDCFLRAKERKCDLLSKNERITHESDLLSPLFWTEWRDQFSHSCSFLKSDESESLFNMSDLLVFWKQIALWAKKQRGKEQKIEFPTLQKRKRRENTPNYCSRVEGWPSLGTTPDSGTAEGLTTTCITGAHPD